MRKIAFILAATLVANLISPAAITYAMAPEAVVERVEEVSNGQEEEILEIMQEETEDAQEDINIVHQQESKALEMGEDASYYLSEDEELTLQCAEYAEWFNEEYGGVHINPLYAGVISEDDIASDIEAMESDVIVCDSTLTTKKAIVNYIRQKMVARENPVSFTVPFELLMENSYILVETFNEAMAHTETCSGQEGDALEWCYYGYDAETSSSSDGITVTYTFNYWTTKAQEKALTEKVNQIMESFNFTNETSEYDKIKTIHDYICDNVDYDHTYTKYSAYDALCTGTSVCEGYAVAFYRLCKEAGLSVRVVTGKGQNDNHGWNIVKIGDVYYNIDCTWDGQDSETEHSWFLLNEIDFVGHTRAAVYQTEEFYNTYPMAEYSYGKTTISTLNKENFNYSFKTIDDTMVSSAANGKPKVLIFFNTGCINSQSTISDLASYDLGGLDIYCVDVRNNTIDNVREFKETFGSDNLVFCYDAGSGSSSAMWQYARAAGMEKVGYPVICYIDGNNKLQYVTSGISNGRQMIYYLKATCGYVEQYKEYTINYHLDGGNNHAENPTVFYSVTDTITLKPASKTGYAFYGWYTEPEFVNNITKIQKGTRQNFDLYAKFVKELELTLPNKTTYSIGEKIDLTGGHIVHNESGKSADISSSMITGFSTEKEGVSTVTVTYQKCKTTFDVLVVKAPEADAMYGQDLGNVSLPENEYGTFSWNDENEFLNQVGENTFSLTFQPKDTRFSARNDIKGKVFVYREISGKDILCSIKNGENFVYNGYPYKPEILVLVDGEPLSEQDYSVHYGENINAGEGTYRVEGKNYYTGSQSGSFTIKKADLTIIAKDVFLAKGSKMPSVWKYEVEGLVKGDVLVTEPAFTITAKDTQTTGRYQIIPKNATAGINYNSTITYKPGELKIAEEKVGYTVTFDLQGHGDGFEYFGVKAGGSIESPETPVTEGYQFDGWYKDVNYKNVWNFESDTVQADIVLYAKWMEVKNNFRVSEIKDMVYSGKALQPAVEVYDGETLLKAKKDYTITYHNNVNVNSSSAAKEFDEALPYVTITGKGNYKDSVKVNFNIVPAVLGDGTQIPSAGVAVNYTEQLTVDVKNAVNPLKSVKLGKNLKKDIDYTVSLEAINAKDGDNVTLIGEMEDGLIPCKSKGTFELKITGIGNYSGSIVKSIFVAEKTYLLKNAKITLGKNLKTIDFSEYKKERNSSLPAAYYDTAKKKYYAVENGSINDKKEVNSKDVFIVKHGNTSLVHKKDFDVEYQNDDKTGKATLVIVGKGNYLGTNSVTYTLTGKPFNAKNVTVSGIETKTYTGKPLTQNNVQLIYNDGSEDGVLLEYGKDYTISYAKHINKGTATMTFTAKSDSGYSGSIKKTFKINAADIHDVSQKNMENITLEYTKNGVKPIEEITLVNEKGIILVYGKDYTLSYVNNKSVADKTMEDKAPVIIVKGKGNYAGEPLRIPFTITKASLDNANIKIEVKEVAYNPKKPATYQYKPSVKITDGGKTLGVNKDYKIEYVNNTQEAYNTYLESGKPELMPKVVITAVENGNYKLNNAIELALPIYQIKLSTANLYAVCKNGFYTGEQVSTEVTVYYTSDKNLLKKAKMLTKEEEILALGLVKLEEGKDYTVSYGKNIAAGKNKGTVTVKGKAPVYGGSVNFKFTIDNKKIEW